MSDRPSGVSRWVRGLFGGSDEPPDFQGEEGRLTGTRALLSAEGSVSDAVCRLTGAPPLPVKENAFGRAVADTVLDRAGGAVATAGGLTMYGRRVAVFVPAERIAEWRDPLRSAADRYLPLVVQANLEPSTHAGYHAASGLAPLVALARDAQQAVDLTLIVRRAAEQALVPGIVAIDGPETAWGLTRILLPDPELVRAYLGEPGESIECPTPAQQLLFHGRRPRVPRWFDLDRPAAHGVEPGPRNVDAVAIGRRAYFADHVPEILERSIAEFEAATGRSVGRLSSHRIDGAKQVLIAQGAAVAVAEAVADRLAQSSSARIGVLGLTWMRPFPAEAIREALAGAEIATVLERSAEAPDGTPPLLAEIRAALAGSGPRLLSATFDRPSESELAAVCRNMKAGDLAADGVRLGASVPEVTSDFPRREALWQRLRRDYPEIDRATLDLDEPSGTPPASRRCFVLRVRDAAPPEELLERLADALDPDASGRLTAVGRDLWDARVTIEGNGPTATAPSRVVLTSQDLLSGERLPFSDRKRADALVVASGLSAEQLWPALPASCRDEIRRNEIAVYAAQKGAEALIPAAAAIGSGEAERAGLIEIDWSGLDDPPRPAFEPDLPLVVRRFGETATRYDNVARFWGEQTRPGKGSEPQSDAPDPYLALGSVPICTSTFVDRTGSRESYPSIDPSLCTGCGKCWVACPDSAIAPTALGAESLLNAAADRAAEGSREDPDPAESKLRRAHKQMAAHLNAEFAKQGQGTVQEELLRESFEWLVGKMKPDADELPKLQEAFEKTIAGVVGLPVTVTEPFFLEPHRDSKGSGELLMLCVDPRSCQACGLCAATCPEQAIRMEPQTAEAADRLRNLWRTWEKLPDTAGKTVARAAGHPEVGPLSAILLSRHCLFSMPGGDDAEPGSGERLAARQVAAVVEYQMQRRTVACLDELESLAGKLREAIREEMARALPVDDLDRLDQALGTVPSRSADAGPILSRLEELGEKTVVDTARVHDLVQAAQEIEGRRFEIAEGSRGVGRARFGVVVAGRSAASWAAGFPHNPFAVPLTVDLTGHAADLALGLARGLLDERVAEVRAERRAKLLLEAPADLVAKQREIDALDWQGLTPDEQSTCPSVLVLAGEDTLAGPGLAGLSALLSSDLPVKVVLLDGLDLLSRRADPALLALAHRRAFVLASSVAHHDHLFHGLTAALDAGGPALIHLHAPSPGRHGFPTDETTFRARLAVASRVHPLLRYEPAAEGVFGLRLSLDGNPEADRPWVTAGDGAGTITPAHWAAGEARYERALEEAPERGTVPIEEYLKLSPGARGSDIPTVPDRNGRSLVVGDTFLHALQERGERWATLQEMSGVVTPFADRLREGMERELKDAHQAELAALKVEYEARLAELENSQVTDQARRLRDRLMQLAGFRKPS